MDGKKKSPFELKTQRMTQADAETVRKIARANDDKYLLALSYVMQEVVYIRELLEQQYQAGNGSNHGSYGTNDSENK